MKTPSTGEATPRLAAREPHIRARSFGATAAKTAVVVGTALTLINHPEIFWGQVSSEIALPTLGNYVVPFLVAGYSRHALLRQDSPADREDS